MLNIKTTNMPTHLNLNFEKWLNNFNYANDSKITKFINTIKDQTIEIKFSDSFKRKEVGYLSIGEIKEIIKNNLIPSNSTKNILDGIYARVELIMYAKEIATEISNLTNDDYEKIFEYITFLISVSKWDTYILVEHSNFSNEITFYPNSIHRVKGLYPNEEDIYEMAFIQQLFLLYYRSVCQQYSNIKFADSCKRHDYLSEVIKDSLSIYYTSNYCKLHNNANYFLKSISDTEPDYFSFAGAKYIKDETHFNKIFNEALLSTNEAIKVLFNYDENLYYNLINRNLYIAVLKEEYKDSNNLDITPYDYMNYFEYYLYIRIHDTNISNYILSIMDSFQKHLNMNYRILSVLDYESRLHLIDIMLSKVTSDGLEKDSLLHLKKFIKHNHYQWQGINITNID